MTRAAPTPPSSPSPAESPWRLGGLSARELASRTWGEIRADHVFDRAATLSYYFLFALFPALLFLTTLLGLFALPELMNRLMGFTKQLLPDEAAFLVESTLAEIVQGARGGLLSVGALAALWAGSSGMGSVMTALNVLDESEDPRPWWYRRLVAIGLLIAFSALTILTLVLLVFGGQIGASLGSGVGVAWRVLHWPVAIVFGLLAIALIYHVAPASRPPWRWVTPGAVFALFAWLLMSLGLRTYVASFGNYNATYGSIGGVILLLLWLYLSSVVLLVGAEIDAEIRKAAAARRRPPRPVPAPPGETGPARQRAAA
jgi:membrane protein